jgi:hypothetical protein
MPFLLFFFYFSLLKEVGIKSRFLFSTSYLYISKKISCFYKIANVVHKRAGYSSEPATLPHQNACV